MSDQKLRDLERRWMETGTVEDEAAYLVEMIRSGQLTEPDVRFAAGLGAKACGLAVGLQGVPSLRDWIVDPTDSTKAGWTKERAARAALAAAQVLLPWYEEARPDDPRPRRALELAKNWCLDATDTTVERPDLDEARRALHDVLGGTQPMAGAARSAYFALSAVAKSAHGSLEAARDAIMGATLAYDASISEQFETAAMDAARRAGFACESVGESVRAMVNHAIHEALVPWALGRGDPLREAAQ